MREKDKVWIYRYSLIIFDEELDEIPHIETGIIWAYTFADAMAKLVAYYGDNVIVEVLSIRRQ